jgi:hypothetical protein
MPCNTEFFLQDLAVSGISFVRGVHVGSSRLRLPAPKDQGLQGGQSYLPVHNTSWLRHHVPRGTNDIKSVCLDWQVTDRCCFVSFMLVPKCCKNPYKTKEINLKF